ncbi:MAG: hypothetical protein Q8R01_13465 [Ramlibacter sp.]|nr:hypothetical protein [Ramlibacter sp.]
MTQATSARSFTTEASLVECFVGALQAGRTTFGSLEVTTEWDHRSGFVDVLARDATNTLIAFEAKLRDWKRAFMQAYRNTAYANKAYVLLPDSAAKNALLHKEEFELRGIGLCAISESSVNVLIEAAEQQPLLAWLHSRAHEHFDGAAGERQAAGGSTDAVC